jgi:hypothetical protein
MYFSSQVLGCAPKQQPPSHPHFPNPLKSRAHRVQSDRPTNTFSRHLPSHSHIVLDFFLTEPQLQGKITQPISLLLIPIFKRNATKSRSKELPSFFHRRVAPDFRGWTLSWTTWPLRMHTGNRIDALQFLFSIKNPYLRVSLGYSTWGPGHSSCVLACYYINRSPCYMGRM